MRRTIRLRDGEFRRMISESVKRVLNEFYSNDSTGGQLTVGELIAELQKCDKDARVEIYVGNDTFHCITDVYGTYLFKNHMDYKNWKKEEEEALQNLPPNDKYDHGEDFY
ncbi:MAG: hypothetical protein IKR05_13300 [Prevotella sp.]|nr:hypothetical protein [Prevotella sp.]